VTTRGHISIAGRTIGPAAPCFIIAEAGVNHDGRLDRALRLVDAAAVAGADAVKFQTFAADRLVTADAAKAPYQQARGPAGESQRDMLRRLELNGDAYRTLAQACRDRGLIFLSTPFDEESADLLDEIGVPAFKLSSADLANQPLLTHVARKGKPVLISTGMATLGDVDAAVAVLIEAGCAEWMLLHCVSCYPAAPSDSNLLAMQTLAQAFACACGFSDHTPGTEVALAAAALGASVLEKHLTLECSATGPDHSASLEPETFAAMVRGIRIVESARGDGRKRPVAAEREIAAAVTRSLVAAHDIPAGAMLTADAIVLRRPGTGLPWSCRSAVIGRVARINIPAGSLIALEMLG
jgi:N-acetylneuraminate synthase/N,N'-diacetyllegionaminate synthase